MLLLLEQVIPLRQERTQAGVWEKSGEELRLTGQLNRLIQLAQQMNPPGAASGSARRLKIYYATTAVDPKYNTIPVPRYVLFVNDKSLLTDSYSQYLRNK